MATDWFRSLHLVSCVLPHVFYFALGCNSNNNQYLNSAVFARSFLTTKINQN